MPDSLIINKGESIINKSEDDLIRIVKNAEATIFEELMKIFDNTDITQGKLTNSPKAEEFISRLDSLISSTLKKSGYNEGVKKYVKNFDLLSKNIKELHASFNGINITSAQIDPFKRIEVANAVDKLLGSGINKDFVNPIRQSLYRNVLFGASLSETEKIIKNYVISNANGDSKLMRYVKQVSRDSISQFDGAVQQGIAQELNLNAKRYVGSLIMDSRAQCVHWVNAGIILNDDLIPEIQIALNGGTFEGKKCTGMNPETTINTFDIYRGGYNCRHRSIPTKFYKK